MIRKALTALVPTLAALACLTAAAPPAAARATVPVPAPDAGRPIPVYLWEDGVRVHLAPSTGSPVLARLNHQWLTGICQTRAETVTVPGVGTNDWWTKVEKRGGSDDAWVTNLYLRGGRKIAGLPVCPIGSIPTKTGGSVHGRPLHAPAQFPAPLAGRGELRE